MMSARAGYICARKRPPRWRRYKNGTAPCTQRAASQCFDSASSLRREAVGHMPRSMKRGGRSPDALATPGRPVPEPVQQRIIGVGGPQSSKPAISRDHGEPIVSESDSGRFTTNCRRRARAASPTGRLRRAWAAFSRVTGRRRRYLPCAPGRFRRRVQARSAEITMAIESPVATDAWNVPAWRGSRCIEAPQGIPMAELVRPRYHSFLGRPALSLSHRASGSGATECRHH